MEKNSGSVDLRIVGGKDARPTKWPFILSLHKNGMFKCGATIIDENWILTAAHCVQKFDEDQGHFQVNNSNRTPNSKNKAVFLLACASERYS